MAAGLCDAVVVVGGVDVLCFMTLYGFCLPGPAVALAPVAPARRASRRAFHQGKPRASSCWNAKATRDRGLCFLGYGESSDAPICPAAPGSLIAVLAMERALDRAELKPIDIDYINLHGTGTPANDLAEDRAIWKTFEKERRVVRRRRGPDIPSALPESPKRFSACSACSMNLFQAWCGSTTGSATPGGIILRSESRPLAYRGQ